MQGGEKKSMLSLVLMSGLAAVMQDKKVPDPNSGCGR